LRLSQSSELSSLEHLNASNYAKCIAVPQEIMLWFHTFVYQSITAAPCGDHPSIVSIGPNRGLRWRSTRAVTGSSLDCRWQPERTSVFEPLRDNQDGALENHIRRSGNFIDHYPRRNCCSCRLPRVQPLPCSGCSSTGYPLNVLACRFVTTMPARQRGCSPFLQHVQRSNPDHRCWLSRASRGAFTCHGTIGFCAYTHVTL